MCATYFLRGCVSLIQVDMDIEGGARLSEININMNQRKVCQHPFLFGEPKDKVTGEFAGVKNPEVNVKITPASRPVKSIGRRPLHRHKVVIC